jgi:predicted nucleic acid-binding protein
LSYLLDTCLVSELLKSEPNTGVTDWVQAHDELQMYLSVLTLGEIQKGISKLTESPRKTSLQDWIDTDLRTRFEGRILAIDLEVALRWGAIQGEAEAIGRRIPAVDGLIGATAIVNKCAVVTRNVADIERTGVSIVNPWV